MEFKNRLSLNESISMIEEVVASVFKVNDDGSIVYMPHVYDYALRLAIAKYYGGYEMTGDNDVDYEVAMDIDTSAINTMDANQYKGILDAIKEMIEFKKSEIHKNNITIVSHFDEVATALTVLISNISDKFSSLDITSLEQFDIKKLVEEYANSERYKGNTASIIDAKNEKIKKLQAELNKYTAKNVVSMSSKDK